jgi:dUTPase
MQTFEVKVKLDEGGVLPKQAHEGDVAVDLYTAKDVIIAPNMLKGIIVPTNIHTEFDSTTHGLFISPRSSIYKYPLALANSTGIIEGNYRGVLGIPLKNTLTPITSLLAGYILKIGVDGNITKIGKKQLSDQYPDACVDYYTNIEKDWTTRMTDEMMGTKAVSNQLAGLKRGFFLEGSILIPKGTRLMQMYILPKENISFNQVDELSDSNRGTGGFGSSGVA